jgi:hypothetical protein
MMEKEKIEAAERWITDHLVGRWAGSDFGRDLVCVNGVKGVVALRNYVGSDAVIEVSHLNKLEDLGDGKGSRLRLVF